MRLPLGLQASYQNLLNDKVMHAEKNLPTGGYFFGSHSIPHLDIGMLSQEF